MNVLARMAVWFASVFISIGVFSVLFSMGSIAEFFFVYRITLIFALPAAFLYLPVVVAIKDAQQGRFWALLASGILIGPVSLALSGLILQLRGTATASQWRGDDIGPGLGYGLVLALIVGALTTTFYLAALRAIPRRNAG
ncbi:MAG TPA: hypothetical protein VLI55_01570 [Bryobacteraceae bacterium]|nr:hypothetical protein [Bryobacteraceae bacterium]